VLWTAGKEGSVRWWGGKMGKVCIKSPLCGGSISAFEMDETVVVAGYDGRGMQAWDVGTQQPLCTFRDGKWGGIIALQFDKRKVLSLSKCGHVSLWRWYSMYPHFTFPPPRDGSSYTSFAFDEKYLILGTTGRQALVYKLDSRLSKKPCVYDY
jgi:hypothetical protein